ncbi:MAG: F0F1 ATP synthase subunit B' [Reyranellaceae bacterium]
MVKPRSLYVRFAPALAAAAVSFIPFVVLAEEKKKPMPQFNPNTMPSQIFWLIVCFAVFYVIISRVVVPMLGGTIDARAAKIQGDLDAAARARDEAKAALAQYEKSIADARAEAQAANRAASDAAAAATNARLAEVGQRIGGEIAAAETRITEAREAAMGNVRSMAVEVAQAAYGKLVGGQADSARLDALVGAALKGGA